MLSMGRSNTSTRNVRRYCWFLTLLEQAFMVLSWSNPYHKLIITNTLKHNNITIFNLLIRCTQKYLFLVLYGYMSIVYNKTVEYLMSADNEPSLPWNNHTIWRCHFSLGFFWIVCRLKGSAVIYFSASK